jgi:hypothetical protein
LRKAASRCFCPFVVVACESFTVSIEDDDLELTEQELKDKHYERLKQTHLEKEGKPPTR